MNLYNDNDNVLTTSLLLLEDVLSSIEGKPVYDKNILSQLLVQCAKMGLYHSVQHLVYHGADLLYENSKALQKASQYGYLEIVKFLHEQGANIHANNENALANSVYYGHYHIAEYLLEHHANIHADNEKAIYTASLSGNIESLRFLIDHGADYTMDNNQPFKVALKFGFFDVIRFWVEEMKLDINYNSGDILYYCFKYDYTHILRYLWDVAGFRFNVQRQLHAIDSHTYTQEMMDLLYDLEKV